MKELPKELPKELTPELLGLVLDKEVQKFTVREDNIICFIKNKTFKDSPSIHKPINIDTLAILMKKWCANRWWDIESSSDTDEGFAILSDCKNEEQIQDRNKFEKEFVAPTEFEAVLKATHWVMKEKDLL